MSTFKFIAIQDGGTGASCPHCGAEGRWIYTWEQDGVTRSAMAGCYKALTGQLSKGDDTRYFELLAEKQAKGKPLNGWDTNVLRLQKFMQDGKYAKDWCEMKIREVLRQRKQYLATKRY